MTYSHHRPFWTRWYHAWLDRNKPLVLIPPRTRDSVNVGYLIVGGTLEVTEPTR